MSVIDNDEINLEEYTLQDIPSLVISGNYELALKIAKQHNVRLCDICDGEGIVGGDDDLLDYYCDSYEDDDCDNKYEDCECCDGQGYYKEDRESV